jgi:hypothetical protein
MLGDDPDTLDPKELRAPAKDMNESDDADEWRDHLQKTDAYQEKRSKTSEYLMMSEYHDERLHSHESCPLSTNNLL